ncbi:HAD family hydrolase [Pseudonocardia nematodicida]|uniref:HAD family hydrolase n=1 Tax=Pseudonocardia nematodicida TaxID=1206997 RepID=A0ABV1K9U0_9PSEU
MIAEKQPRLVATDVDGTLLDDRDAVSPRTAAVISRAVAAGAEFVLVTGRPPRWIPPVVARLPEGHVRWCVCANGAVVYDAAADVVLSARTLEPEAVRKIAALCGELFPGVGLGVERVGTAETGGVAHGTVDEFLAEPGYVHAWGANDAGPATRDELLARPVTKLLIRSPELTSEQMLERLAPEVDGLADLTFSHPSGLIEASAPGVTKATGLADVAQRLGVDAAETVAFGDMPNDREMLRWAGVGVAMGNAHPDLIGVADEVTAPNTADGLAEVLERWF